MPERILSCNASSLLLNFLYCTICIFVTKNMSEYRENLIVFNSFCCYYYVKVYANFKGINFLEWLLKR
jgi:hypothetical protein